MRSGGRSCAFVFSGQGSQYYGMGRELFEGDAAFRRSMERFDEMFADHGLPGVLAEIYRSDRSAAQPFDDLRFTHPAIVMTELSLAEAVRARGVEPDFVIGASLGEFAAATVAGVLDVEQVVTSIVAQVDLVHAHCPLGGMLAVIGEVDQYYSQRWSERGLALAAINYDRHFVVSGDEVSLAGLEGELRRRRVTSMRLGVRYPFHSPLMDDAAEPYLELVSRLSFAPPVTRFVSCDTAAYVDKFEPRHFWRMVRSPVRFRDAVRFLRVQEGDVDYLDLGPSGTMANFAKNILGKPYSGRVLALLDPFARNRALVNELLNADNGEKNSVPPRRRGVTMRAHLFPGQGSQHRGMGRELFDRFPERVREADEVLGYPITELCLEDPRRELDRTDFTQPALYVVNALAHLARTEAGENPDFLAGHSLGEYVALFAAGVFSFADGLRLVRERGALMARATGGGMAAVIGMRESAVRQVLAGREDLQSIDLANLNAPDQLILSGPSDTIAQAKHAFAEAGARAYIPLKVSGAFHSRYMAAARDEFARKLAEFTFTAPKLPVISNVTGMPYGDGDPRVALADQLVKPVRWEESVRYLLEQGVTEFDELGPGAVLTKLVDTIRREPVREVRRPVESRTAAALPVSAAAQQLGSAAFRKDYGLRLAYVCGAMYRGIASEEMVVRAGRAGMLAFFGTGGLSRDRVSAAITKIRSALASGEPFGMNLVHDPMLPVNEEETVDLLLRHGVDVVEASAFIKVTPALVRYRLTGLRKGDDGRVVARNRIIAKVSRPEVVESFLSPAPERIVRALRDKGVITADEAALASVVPMADDVCVEADSGGHTDGGQLVVLLPSILRQRDRLRAQHGYDAVVRVGAAGGIGTPEAAAAAFLMGADFVVTGSINLCTVQSGMSDPVKDMLEQIDVQDTGYAPAGDMFELGAQVQVLKRGVFFPARARKLHELYRRHESLDEIDSETRTLIEGRYFHRSFDEIWQETKAHFLAKDPREVEKAEQNPKHKMALVFRWYFGHSQRAAMAGAEEYRVDYQVHCGPALGAFNNWVRGTEAQSWRKRNVDEIGVRLMDEAAALLGRSVAGR